MCRSVSSLDVRRDRNERMKPDMKIFDDMKRIMILIASASLLCGCGIYGRYSRPELDVEPDSLYREYKVPEDTVTVASMPWRELFTDPCLQELIAIGIERNADMNIARLQVEEARAVLMNARLSYLPAVSLAPQAAVRHYSGETEFTYNIGASATWEIDVFGKLTNARRGARAALESSCAYMQAVQTQLVAAIAESYYTLLMLDSQLAISGQTLVNWDETITALEALAEAGRANEVAVHQARASRMALSAQMLSMNRSIYETENMLSALLKEPSRHIERGSLDGQEFSGGAAAGIPLQLVSRRPDIRQAEAELAKAFYATNEARSAFYPSITLSGTLGWTNSAGASVMNPKVWLSNAIAQLMAPLFNRGTNIANLKVAKARQEEALLRFEQSLLDAGNEVNNAVSEWQTANGRIEYDLQQIADLEEAVEKTQFLVRYTTASYLEVLTAQQSLLAAKLVLVQDQVSRIDGVIHLYHALGGGAD